jgi:hypothetical protein
MRVLYKSFESQFITRQKILQKAAEFASEIGADRLINISHSEDHHDSIVTIWYWDGPKQEKPAAAPVSRTAVLHPADPARSTAHSPPETLADICASLPTDHDHDVGDMTILARAKPASA